MDSNRLERRLLTGVGAGVLADVLLGPQQQQVGKPGREDDGDRDRDEPMVEEAAVGGAPLMLKMLIATR